MINSLYTSWITFKVYRKKLMFSLCLAIGFLSLGYFIANVRYGLQNYPVTGEYIANYLEEQRHPAMVSQEDERFIITETSTGECYFLFLNNNIGLSRIYEFEFSIPVDEMALLKIVNGISQSSIGKIILYSFDGSKAVVEISIQTLCSTLQFQQSWRGLLNVMDTYDAMLYSRLAHIVGEDNVRSSIVPFAELGRIYRVINDAGTLEFDYSSHRNMLDHLLGG